MNSRYIKVNSKIYLPEWENDLSEWKFLTHQTDLLKKRVVTQKSFENKHYTFFKSFPVIDQVISTLETNSDSLRPFSELIHSNDNFYEKYFIDEIIESILKIYNLSPTTQRFLLLGYVNRQDNHNQKLNQENKISFFKYFGDNKFIDYVQTKKIGLLSEVPVSEVVKYSIENKLDPQKSLNNCGIDIDLNSSFFNQLETQYTLELLKTISFESHHPLSNNIINKKLYHRKFTKPELIGHQIIKIILDHPSKKHESWTEMILEFAGDPRSKEGTRYRKWWGILGEKYIKGFEKLLSQLDILFFLDALKEFAIENDSDMKRMFHSRKKFLTGLATHDLIISSRLFLPSEVKKYIEKNQSNISSSYVCDLTSSKRKSIIYIKVGSFHIFEGSHNCKIRIYPKSPPHTLLPFDSPSLKTIEYREITTELERNFKDHYSNNYISKSHSPNGSWKKHVIQFIKPALTNINQKTLFTEEEYNRFRHSFYRTLNPFRFGFSSKFWNK